MRILLLSLFLLGAFFACKKQSVNTSGGKFAARLTDPMWGEDNRLINHVHESEWTIAYAMTSNCDMYELPEDRVFEDAISRAIQLWLEPVKKVAESMGKSVVVNFKYAKIAPPKQPYGPLTSEEQSHRQFQAIKRQETLFTENNVKLRIQFDCSLGISYVPAKKYQLPFIRLFYDDYTHAGTIEGTHFNFSTLLHEMGHTFGLLDTYSPDDAGQPVSIMSSAEWAALGEDDIKGIQWLYLYTHARDKLPKENLCFFADYEPSKWKNGVCLPKHPLITLLKQAEKHEVLGNNKAARNILEKARKAIGTHLFIDHNKINAQDGDSNTALHLTVKYYLESTKRHPQHPSSWSLDSHLPGNWAIIGVALLHYLRHCPNMSKEDGERLTQEERKQAFKVMYEECVKRYGNYCACIDPQIKNNEGKTARDLAVDANAADIVQAIDAALKRP